MTAYIRSWTFFIHTLTFVFQVARMLVICSLFLKGGVLSAPIRCKTLFYLLLPHFHWRYINLLIFPSTFKLETMQQCVTALRKIYCKDDVTLLNAVLFSHNLVSFLCFYSEDAGIHYTAQDFYTFGWNHETSSFHFLLWSHIYSGST